MKTRLLVLCVALLLVVDYCVGGEDPYKVLGVSRSVSEQDLKKAYRKLSRQYHPDKNTDDPDANSKWLRISEAYEVLSDPDRRAHYDRTGISDPPGPGRGHQGSPFEWFQQQRRGQHPPIFSETLWLSRQNFDHYVRQDGGEVWMIEFYADWCGECRDLAPSWDKAARQLAGVVNFGRVNTDEEFYLARRFNVRNVPTIVAYYKGEYHSFRGNIRDTSLVKEFAGQFFPDRVQRLTEDTLQNLQKKYPHKILVVLFSKQANPSVVYRYLATILGEYMVFGQVHIGSKGASALAAKFGVGQESRVVLVSAGEEHIVYGGDMEVAQLRAFLWENRFPSVPRASHGNFAELCGSDGRHRPCLLYFAAPEDAVESPASHRDLAALRKLGARGTDMADRVQLAWTSSATQSDATKMFNVDSRGPAVVFVDPYQRHFATLQLDKKGVAGDGETKVASWVKKALDQDREIKFTKLTRMPTLSNENASVLSRLLSSWDSVFSLAKSVGSVMFVLWALYQMYRLSR